MTGSAKPKRQARPTAGKTREEWLTEVADAMASWYDDLGFPLPDFRITTGFPSSGRRGRDAAEAWSEDGGKSFAIFIRPDQKEPNRVAAALARQLAHIAAGERDKHGHLFRHIAISIGLRGSTSEAAPGRLFKELAGPILERAGPLPAAARGPAGQAESKKQSSRLIKVSCGHCGYVARVSRKWLNQVGAPLCPLHGPMLAAK